ncbi:MAG: acyl-CoA desaturase [Pedosphaera sp. Tous-C6FEB]|nr:MAG: acyl-CoA desaturase [Pedosphaera sp. Tous-C6FEB]
MARTRMTWQTVNWYNTVFLLGTLLVTLTAVPVYLWHYGLSWFHAGLFLLFFILTGQSITMGYHRLFSHHAFQASWPVRLLTLVFGAAAFENSALTWCADHRQHHKHTDHEEDPYDISKGFFHAHMGWIMFKLGEPPVFACVPDLERDPLVRWQHKYYVVIGVLAGFVLPAVLGWFYGGGEAALGAFLIAGVARTVFVHHSTFFINSLCHTLGTQPYSDRCTARDSWFMAFFTFGEGYHNFHHAFQHDYRNGVKAWQFDPTKWTIWLLAKVGLASQLRRVPDERIRHAEITEQQRQLAARMAALPAAVVAPVRAQVEAVQARLHEAFERWEKLEVEYRRAMEKKIEASREKANELSRDFREAREKLVLAFQEWEQTHSSALSTMLAGA